MIKNFSDYMDIQEMVPSTTKKQLKRQRERKYKRKLRRIAFGHHRCMPPAFPIGLNRKYAEEGEDGFVRYKRSYSPRRGKWLKKFANKVVRRNKDVPSRGCYKKCFDYQWTIW